MEKQINIPDSSRSMPKVNFTCFLRLIVSVFALSGAFALLFTVFFLVVAILGKRKTKVIFFKPHPETNGRNGTQQI